MIFTRKRFIVVCLGMFICLLALVSCSTLQGLDSEPTLPPTPTLTLAPPSTPTPIPTSTPASTSTPTSTPTPLVIASPGRSNTYTAGDLNDACERILPFNGAAVFENAPPDQPILWTFGVNFEVLSPDRNPVGCFKLYEKDEPAPPATPSYKPISDHEYIADVCTVFEAVPGDVTFAPGQATFNGGGHIECEMNLGDWMEQVEQSELPGSELADLLHSFYQDSSGAIVSHNYENFTFVAEATVSGSLSSASQLLPIVSYHPADLSYTSPELSLLWIGGSGLVLGNCKYTPMVGTPYYWWYDLRKQAKYQQYVYREISSTGDVDCGFGLDSNPLVFSIEEGKLYIGYNPDTPTDYFLGTMEGVLVDPTDSKPK